MKILNFKFFGTKHVKIKLIVQTPTQHKSTQPQPNLTLVGLDRKMTLHTHHTQKLNVSNILADTEQILMRLSI